MQVERLELKDGQWVKAHTRPSVKQMQALTRSVRRNTDTEDGGLAVLIETVLLLCEEWQVKGADGANLPLTREGIEEAPFDMLQEVSDKLAPYLRRDVTVLDQLNAVADGLDDDDPVKGPLLGFIATLGNP